MSDNSEKRRITGSSARNQKALALKIARADVESDLGLINLTKDEQCVETLTSQHVSLNDNSEFSES